MLVGGAHERGQLSVRDWHSILCVPRRTRFRDLPWDKHNHKLLMILFTYRKDISSLGKKFASAIKEEPCAPTRGKWFGTGKMAL